MNKFLFLEENVKNRKELFFKWVLDLFIFVGEMLWNLKVWLILKLRIWF